jgi:Cu-Zn family superoxide dismutase
MAACAALAFVAVGCESGPEAGGVSKAVAVLSPTQGNNVQGTVTFTREKGGVRVVANITGLTPGAHGFHVHEKGDCSAHDGSSAGGHFNPTGAPHGAPTAAQHHVGDMGNVLADAKGVARLSVVFPFLQLDGPHSILDKAVIVHAAPDDFSQPVGNAGARVACGAILAK